MTKKTCFRCGEKKELEEFYRHGAMADGCLNKCKSCCRSESIANRNERIDYYREYDRSRQSTDGRRAWAAERQRRYRSANPTKNAARAAVKRAVRSGALVRGLCEVCMSAEVDAHHDDYSKPLSVRWLCRKHHIQLHSVSQSAY